MSKFDSGSAFKGTFHGKYCSVHRWGSHVGTWFALTLHFPVQKMRLAQKSLDQAVFSFIRSGKRVSPSFGTSESPALRDSGQWRHWLLLASHFFYTWNYTKRSGPRSGEAQSLAFVWNPLHPHHQAAQYWWCHSQSVAPPPSYLVVMWWNHFWGSPFQAVQIQGQAGGLTQHPACSASEWT